VYPEPVDVTGTNPDAFTSLVASLNEKNLRFVVIGVSGANYYAASGRMLFTTLDRDLFLPLDPKNTLGVLETAARTGFDLRAGGEPLIQIDSLIAERIVERQALVTASYGKGLDIDFTHVMAGFDFETVWSERRTFLVHDVPISVARLSQILASKAADRTVSRGRSCSGEGVQDSDRCNVGSDADGQTGCEIRVSSERLGARYPTASEPPAALTEAMVTTDS
jgi:hypothetical protein